MGGKPPFQKIADTEYDEKNHKQHSICNVKYGEVKASVFNTSHFQCGEGRKCLTTSKEFGINRGITDYHHDGHGLAKCAAECHHCTCNDSRPDCRKNKMQQGKFSGESKCDRTELVSLSCSL